jgi:glycosyltransferase involved in cell wall biosynthesis
MKILHTIPSMGINSGGPASSTFLTVKGLRNKDVTAKIVTYQISGKSDKLISSENFIHTLPPVNNKFAYSRYFKTFLLQNSKEYDIFHAQSVWLYPTCITAKIARKLNKPYIITPRGMLYPQDLANGKLRKSIFLKLFLQNDLQKANCIHATCMEEMRYLRDSGIKTPVAVIPNPVDTADMESPVAKTKLRAGYLGRVHPRKNIERIIYAWNMLKNSVNDGELIIIGDGDKQYLDFLKRETKRLQLNNVIFTGFLSGDEKEKALNSLSFLVVTSDFENFGNIVTEALVKGIPVISSKGTPWQELNSHRCGWWIDNDVDTVANTLNKAIILPEEEYRQMGMRGQKLIKENYSVETVAQKMKQLYCWILQKGEKPEFVYE